MKSVLTREVKIGLLVIVAIAILVFGINFLKGINLFKAANYYYAVYDNVEGLAVSAPVNVNGFKVGLVREIKYDYNHPGHVVVEFSVDKAMRLPRGSEAILVSDILGTTTVDLRLGHGDLYAVGDTVPGRMNAGMLAAVSDNLMPAVNSILPKVDTLLASLNMIVTDPALTASIKRLDNISAELEASVRSLHGVMNNLQPIARDVKNITGNVDSISGNLAIASEALRDAPIDSIMKNLEETVANVNRLTESLNNPDSSIGRFANDPALYNNLNAAAASLDSLLIDVKRNPKRYISIKLL